MAPKRRLFEPPVQSPVPRNEYMRGAGGDVLTGFQIQPPPEKPKSVSLEEALRDATEEPDDDLAAGKMIQLLRTHGQQLREKWGEDTFKTVASGLGKKFANMPLQRGQPAPTAANFLTDRESEGSAARDFEGMLDNVSEIPTLPAQAWERFGPETIPADQLRYGSRAEAIARGTVHGVGQVAAAIPDLGVGLGRMAGTGIAAATGGAPSGPGVGDQAASMTDPMVAAGEYIGSAPAIVADLTGHDPNQLPGVLARSEDYIRSLYGRAAENPAEPAMGALMAGGLARGAIAGKRRIFAPRELAPAPVQPQPAPFAGQVGPPPMQAPAEPLINPPPFAHLPAEIPEPTLMPQQPIAWETPQPTLGPQRPPAPGPRNVREIYPPTPEPTRPPAGPSEVPPPFSGGAYQRAYAPVDSGTMPQQPIGQLPPRQPAPAPSVPASRPRTAQEVFRPRSQSQIDSHTGEFVREGERQPFQPPHDAQAVPPQVRRDVRRFPAPTPEETEGRHLGAPPEEPNVPLESMTAEQRLHRLERLVGKGKAGEGTGAPVEKPPAAQPPSEHPAPDLSAVDKMIDDAKKTETTVTERPAGPGKKRLSVRGPGPGTVRPVKRFGPRGRGGAVVVPSLATVTAQLKQIGSDIAGVARRLMEKPQPKPAPAPGTPGGPGNGTPFRAEPMTSTLRLAAPPKSFAGYVVDMLLHPSSVESFWHRTGLNRMGIEATRIGNVMREHVQSFLWGDPAGKAWLKEQFQKAGPDLWSAVIATREQRDLTPAETAARDANLQAFNQLTGPAFRLLDHVRALGVYRDLGPDYWPYDWGSIADVNNLAEPVPFKPKKTPGVGPDKARTTWDAPLRNPVDVIDEYANSLVDKFTRRQIMQHIEQLRPQLDARGQMMLDGYTNGVLFKVPGLVDKVYRDWKLGNSLKDPPKVGDAFDLDGAWGLDGKLKIVDEAYDSKGRGQTYSVQIDGKDWLTAFSGPELAALKLGKNMPVSNGISGAVGVLNGLAAYRSIAGNLRSFWRQLTGGQGRFIAESTVNDYSYGHAQAAKYWASKLSPAEMQMLHETGLMEEATSVDGLDQRSHMLKKALMSNVYVPDTHTKIAAWFAEWQRLGRERPGLSREARMDAATDFALRVSDANLSLVQSPWGDNVAYSALGLFNKSRLRQLRHMVDLAKNNPQGFAKGAATAGAVMAGMAVIGKLNAKELRSLLWAELPMGESIGAVFGDPARNPAMIGAPGLDVAVAYAVGTLKMLKQSAMDAATGHGWGSTWRDVADEADRRMRVVVPMSAAYRTASDLTRATLADSTARGAQGQDVSAARAARASLVTAPQPPYQTQYQKSESGHHSSGGRRGGSKKRLFQGF